MSSPNFRIGSLFSGIGGLELGLENAGLGQTVWQVENDPFCREVLARRWPEAERFEDVCKVGSSQLSKVDLICGGFPCQDVSSAGSRKGLTGERSGLWREYARIVGELRPSWVVVENVTSGAKLWVDTIREDLGGLGYETLPVPVRADALGAPYPRARIFVVARRLANPDRDGELVPRQHAEASTTPELGSVAEGSRERSESKHQSVAPADIRRRDQNLYSRNPWRTPMPDVAGVVPGAPPRVAAQRAAGNCVVPICAEVAGWVIRELIEESVVYD